jgi:hypothetical protein
MALPAAPRSYRGRPGPPSKSGPLPSRRLSPRRRRRRPDRRSHHRRSPHRCGCLPAHPVRSLAAWRDLGARGQRPQASIPGLEERVPGAPHVSVDVAVEIGSREPAYLAHLHRRRRQSRGSAKVKVADLTLVKDGICVAVPVDVSSTGDRPCVRVTYHHAHLLVQPRRGPQEERDAQGRTHSEVAEAIPVDVAHVPHAAEALCGLLHTSRAELRASAAEDRPSRGAASYPWHQTSAPSPPRSEASPGHRSPDSPLQRTRIGTSRSCSTLLLHTS